MKHLAATLALLLSIALAGTSAQQPKTKADLEAERAEIQRRLDALQKKADAPPIVEQKYPRGRISPSPEVLNARHAAAFARHDSRMMSLPTALPAAFDCRDGGYMPSIDDQKSCGSCHLVSGADTCEIQMMKAGVIPANGGGLAKQYGMDCKPNGGCGGGDEYDTIAYIKSHGYPLTSDYYPYEARSLTCRPVKNGGKLYQIADFGFCTPSQEQGVASTQDMKNAIYQYGPISVAFDASGCDSYNGGVMRGRGTNVDHAVICCGWKTENGKTIFLGRNQWGQWGGLGGYFWIEEGSYSWGTEAIWVSVAVLPPPPPPTSITVAVGDASAQVGTLVNVFPVATGGTAPYSWAMNWGDGTTDAATSHLYKLAGNYVLTATATDSKGAIGRGTGKMTISDGPPIPPTPGDYPTITVDRTLAPGTYIALPKAVLDRLRVLDAERQQLLNPK